MRCPVCERSDMVIRRGKRETKKGTVQKLQCKRCGKFFSSSLHPYSWYPDEMVFRAMELYNIGRSWQYICEKLERQYGIEVPRRTIYSWVRRYVKQFGMYALRGYRCDEGNGPLVKRSYYENAENPWKYHSIKLKRSKTRWPKLYDHIKRIDEQCTIPSIKDIQIEEDDITRYKVKIKGPDKSLKGLFYLVSKMYEGPDREMVKEFLLLHHPECWAIDFPIYKMDLGPLSEKQRSSIVSVDMLFVDESKIRLVDFLNSEKEIMERFWETSLLRKAVVHSAGSKFDQVMSSFIVGDLKYDIVLKKPQS